MAFKWKVTGQVGAQHKIGMPGTSGMIGIQNDGPGDIRVRNGLTGVDESIARGTNMAIPIGSNEILIILASGTSASGYWEI